MLKKLDSFWVLIIELILTVGVCFFIVFANITIVSNEASGYVSDLANDYHNLSERYLSVFKALVIQTDEKIKTDPSFEEMDSWLKSHEDAFRDAVGADVYDGFAMTYKGGYAHSWSYGNYDNYDPNTRPWYREAQKANGKAVLVAPYVTFLDPSLINTDQYIMLTVAQKYSDSISFDLDLKITDINSLLSSPNTDYKNSLLLLFNKDGYILSTNNKALYCHNINTPDSSVSQSLSEAMTSVGSFKNTLKLITIDGKAKYVYANTDSDGNTYVIILPFSGVFAKNFGIVALIMLLLIIVELSVYRKNQLAMTEMSERDSRITEIARIAFQSQIYIDIDTMKCTCDDKMRIMLTTNDYNQIFRLLYSDIVDDSSREDFKEFFAPKSLLRYESKGLMQKKYTFDLPSKDGTRIRKILEFSLFVSRLNRKATAVILANDVTDKELAQQRVLQSIAYHYLAVFVGSTLTRRIDIIKTDKYYESVFDPSSSITEINSRYANEFLKPEYIKDFLYAVSPATIAEKLSENEDYSITVALKDGHWHTVKIIRAGGFSDSHQFVFFVENADEQMLRQEQLKNALAKANSEAAAKTDFLSRMSHDIRTPMNGIIGMTRIAQQQENPPRTAECLNNIDISSKYLLGLINDILDMTKIESGELNMNCEPYVSDELMQYLNSVVGPMCAAKHQEFIITDHIDKNSVPVLDKLRINQIIFNLLSNAVKYTPVGGTIECRIDTHKSGTKIKITIVVKDTGIGMSSSFQKILFDPYTQEDRVRSMENMNSSSGLGLAIVKKIVDIMNGTIVVESREGCGSTFTVRIDAPYVDAKNQLAQTRKDRSDFDRHYLNGKRILLCEDNRINQEIAKAVLTQAGITSELADNGLTGTQMFEKSAEGYYDCILMDIRMPIMDGYEATRTIRAMQRKDSDVPIIAMTADAFEDDKKKCLEAGMDGHVAKPLDPQALYGTIVEHIIKNDV